MSLAARRDALYRAIAGALRSRGPFRLGERYALSDEEQLFVTRASENVLRALDDLDRHDRSARRATAPPRAAPARPRADEEPSVRLGHVGRSAADLLDDEGE
jgi:hypothetical protein